LRQIENKEYKGLNVFQTLKRIYQAQGITGLFKGNSASVARIFPFSAVEFWSFEFYKNHLIRGKSGRQNSFLYTSICGALTGLNAITLTFPLDVARTRLAVNTSSNVTNQKGLIATIVDLWKTFGIKGLYKGYSWAFVVILYYLIHYFIFI
jgi:hypothetical protein